MIQQIQHKIKLKNDNLIRGLIYKILKPYIDDLKKEVKKLIKN